MISFLKFELISNNYYSGRSLHNFIVILTKIELLRFYFRCIIATICICKMGDLKITSVYGNKLPENQYLHINRTNKSINCDGIGILKYRDKDTRQIVIYIPSFEVSGYGATDKKAEEMLKNAINDFFEYLLNLSPSKMQAELTTLGWNHSKIRTKDYSKAYVGVDGKLKDFNAVADKVEEGLLAY